MVPPVDQEDHVPHEQVALLALTAEITFALIQRAVTPRGLKLQSARTGGSMFTLKRRIA